MSTLYPRLPMRAARERFKDLRERSATDMSRWYDTTHLAQYFAPTGGTRATQERLSVLRFQVVETAKAHGFPSPLGRSVHDFDTALARELHTNMDLVPVEAAERPMWAFVALVLLPDVAVWRFPDPPDDRVLATDITRHVFGRLWWRAELTRDMARLDDPYHLLGVFPERNFDQILARRRSIGGSPELIRALAKEWPKDWTGIDETDALRDVLKHLMRRGAFQDLYGLPEAPLRLEVARTISDVRHGGAHSRRAGDLDDGPVGRHARR
ncbi:hypothetical protein HH310_21985 [Actinoplanes sp. TBRC 11911]|uniref:DUF6339 family protein n=1 Tax=Actinoplanes sp. TBRC 11911 TaxID=2729386 RepID=UPI00145C8671|nr:DUF6339 family protein [Actinoplanes sp. TBRC 11911]NMO53840.1 hypothetical protein [Actinoplanes sp. TBRC 11911]